MATGGLFGCALLLAQRKVRQCLAVTTMPYLMSLPFSTFSSEDAWWAIPLYVGVIGIGLLGRPLWLSSVVSMLPGLWSYSMAIQLAFGEVAPMANLGWGGNFYNGYSVVVVVGAAIVMSGALFMVARRVNKELSTPAIGAQWAWAFVVCSWVFQALLFGIGFLAIDYQQFS